MASKKRDAYTIAMELLDVRQKKNELNLLDKTLSKELRDSKDFKKQDVFILQPAVTITVKDIEIALAWAEINAPQIIEVNTSKAKKIFAASMSIPDGFESKRTDRLVAKSDSNGRETDQAD